MAKRVAGSSSVSSPIDAPRFPKGRRPDGLGEFRLPRRLAGMTPIRPCGAGHPRNNKTMRIIRSTVPRPPPTYGPP